MHAGTKSVERSKLSKIAIDGLIDSIVIRPVSDFRAPQRSTQNLWLSHTMFDDACNRAGIDRNTLFDTLKERRHPAWEIPVTPELREFLDGQSLIYGVTGDLDKNYYLQVIPGNGRLFVRYQQIIGSRLIGELTDEQMDRLKDKLASTLAQREGKDRLPAEAEQTLESSASSPVEDNGITAELETLVRQGKRISLPAQQLEHYPAIKTIMEKAGGKYSRSGFNFRSESEAVAALDGALGGKTVNVQQETQFFRTPEAEALAAVDELNLFEGARVLEPSAGDGALADVARAAGAHVMTVENWGPNIEALKAKGYVPIESDFLQLEPEDLGLHEAVLMNPPFSRRQDIAHIKHALSFLEPDGTLVAIMSPGFQTSAIKVCKQFKDLLELAQAPITPIEAGAFKESGTNVATVRIKIDMATLLQQMHEAGCEPADYGLDLTKTLHAWRQEQPRIREIA